MILLFPSVIKFYFYIVADHQTKLVIEMAIRNRISNANPVFENQQSLDTYSV